VIIETVGAASSSSLQTTTSEEGAQDLTTIVIYSTVNPETSYVYSEVTGNQQGTGISYNQWGFTGSQSQWSENVGATAYTVWTLNGNVITGSVVASETIVAGTTLTRTTTTSNADLTVTRASSATTTNTANGANGLLLNFRTCSWKQLGALMSVAALTAAFHCI